jgi:peptide-methionine (S)-S-oxide reductase
MTVRATWNGTQIAVSDHTILVEGNHYFPPEDVATDLLVESPTSSHCPWKGDASYYTVVVGDQRNVDAAWYYPNPYGAAAAIEGYLAFWKGASATELTASGKTKRRLSAHHGKVMTMTSSETAVLAGGCFWGMQDLIRKRPGVLSTRVGYTGGEVPNATYRNHGNHAEAIEITFDPALTSYRDLLEFFFQIHDPTTMNRQGNDIGASYRSAIFYTSDEQRAIAEDTIADVEASGLWPGKVVTEVTPAGPFWEAEPEHQDYLERYPAGYTCHFPRPDWKLPRRETSTTA